MIVVSVSSTRHEYLLVLQQLFVLCLVPVRVWHSCRTRVRPTCGLPSTSTFRKPAMDTSNVLQVGLDNVRTCESDACLNQTNWRPAEVIASGFHIRMRVRLKLLQQSMCQFHCAAKQSCCETAAGSEHDLSKMFQLDPHSECLALSAEKACDSRQQFARGACAAEFVD